MMNLSLRQNLVIFVLLLTSFAHAENACLSGKPQNTNILDQLNEAKKSSQVTQIISEQYKLNDKTEAKSDCFFCFGKKENSPAKDLSQISSHIDQIPEAPKLIFKNACLNESNQFDANTFEVTCPGEKKSKTKDLCIDQKVMTYQNAVISSFMSCAQKAGLKTVSPATLFEMYSLESGFKPQFAYNGGVGLGQLTRIFVEDVHQKWRGHKFLQKIAQSDLKECAAAKVIAQKDMLMKPQISNSCSFIQMGEGLERNVLYSLVGMANSWEKDIEPKLHPYLEKYANHPLIGQVRDLSLINAYGPGGRAAARALVSRLSQLPPEKYVERIKTPQYMISKQQGRVRSLNIYNVRMAARQKQIASQLSEPLKTAFEKTGAAACINP